MVWTEISPMPSKDYEEHSCKKFIVPEDYVWRLSDDQGDLDNLHSDLLEVLKEVVCEW